MFTFVGLPSAGQVLTTMASTSQPMFDELWVPALTLAGIEIAGIIVIAIMGALITAFSLISNKTNKYD